MFSNSAPGVHPTLQIFVCLPNQTHLLQLIGSLEETLKWPGKPSPSNSDVSKSISEFERIGWINDSVTRSLYSLLNRNAQTRMRMTKGKFSIVLLARILWLDRHYCVIMKTKFAFCSYWFVFLITFLRHASMLLLGRCENQVMLNIQSGQLGQITVLYHIMKTDNNY